jgi:hypothetical protein
MSSTKSKPDKAAALASMRALIAGMQKHFPNESLTLGNTAYTTDTLVKALQGLADALTAVDAAQANAKDAVNALRAMKAKVGPLERNLRSFLRLRFGTANAQLVDFGVQPAKARTPLTSDKRVVATAKAKATRTARGTTGKKKKLAVKGDVTGVVVTPVTRPASPPPTAAPAVAAPAAPATASAPR